MLIKFFNNTRPITLLVLFLTLVIISVSSVYRNIFSIEFHNLFTIDNHYQYLGSIAHSFLSVFLILALGLLVNFIVHNNSITRDNSFALLFFVLLVAAYPPLSILNPVLASVFFVVLSLKNLLSLHEHKGMTQKLFNAGLFIGIASIIYPYAILYGILLFLGIIIYGADSWRQWFMPVLGIIIPYYILFAWYFWFDGLDYYWDTFFIKTLFITKSSFHSSIGTIVIWGTFSFLTFISILDYFKNMNIHKLDTRKGYAMTYLALFIGIMITLVGSINNGQELIIIFFPISIIWAKFVQHQRKELWKSLFMATVILDVVFSIVINRL